MLPSNTSLSAGAIHVAQAAMEPPFCSEGTGIVNDASSQRSRSSCASSGKGIGRLMNRDIQKEDIFGSQGTGAFVRTSRPHGCQDEIAAQKWFHQSNRAVGQSNLTHHCDSPFFQGETSSSSSGRLSPANATTKQPVPQLMMSAQHDVPCVPTERSSSDDFRSIIDDLTIENRVLRDRLQKYEATIAPELEKDCLFEVKVHGLPSHRKRELMEALQEFASKADIISDTQRAQYEKTGNANPFVSVNRLVRQSTMSSKSRSRRADSAYASASALAPTETRQNQTKPQKSGDENSSESQKSTNQSYVDGTTAGLLSRDSSFMTDREKKILVVQRLEQLFTDEGIPSQKSSTNHQAQVASSYPLTIDKRRQSRHGTEGMREACILSDDESLDNCQSRRFSVTIGEGDAGDDDVGGAANNSPPLPQRPTRPLDLDPDRAQAPVENVEYIRHLGLSPPNLSSEEHTDLEGSSAGWVYLNLLANLAQLHIINVTRDFIRSAITEASTKFELSADRQKIRWRGGSVGTKFGSDGDGYRLGQEMGSVRSSISDIASAKRRKVDHGDASNNEATFTEVGRKFSANNSQSTPRVCQVTQKREHAFEYKPLFAKHSSAGEGLELPQGSTASTYTSLPGDDTEVLLSHRNQGFTNDTSAARPYTRSGLKTGPIVFYSGAPFFTDLSSDSRNNVAMAVDTASSDNYSSNDCSPLGAEARKPARRPLTRSSSWSQLPFRPFKDYSKCAEQGREMSPEIITERSIGNLDFTPAWSAEIISSPHELPMPMVASGLGGTRPDDHFVVVVETAHPMLSTKFHQQLQTTLAQSLDPGQRMAKALHMISKTRLDTMNASSPKQQQTVSLAATGQPHSPPIKISVLSERFYRLSPSPLPPPALYTGDLFDSADGTSNTSSDADLANPTKETLNAEQYNLDSQTDSDKDEDVSIDMLAQDRKLNPGETALRERRWESEVRLGAAGKASSGNGSGIGSWAATAGEEEIEKERAR